jgi:hypothetical protein
MINVTMIKNHGLSVQFQTDSWDKIYVKIKEECECKLNHQPFTVAFASESRWSDITERYEIVKGEYFFSEFEQLRSVGPDVDVQLRAGKIKLIR